MAESAGAGDSYTSKKKKEINETVRQQGTEIASGGDTTVNAGRDITAVASSVTATGNISVNAGRDVALTTATESDYHYLETKKKRRFSVRKPPAPSVRTVPPVKQAPCCRGTA